MNTEYMEKDRMNPFEPDEQNSERQPWWPDPASKPKETDAAPETDKTTPVPEPEEANITPEMSAADAAILDKMEKEIEDLTKSIDRKRKAEEFEKEGKSTYGSNVKEVTTPL